MTWITTLSFEHLVFIYKVIVKFKSALTYYIYMSEI